MKKILKILLGVIILLFSAIVTIVFLSSIVNDFPNSFKSNLKQNGVAVSLSESQEQVRGAIKVYVYRFQDDSPIYVAKFIKNSKLYNSAVKNKKIEVFDEAMNMDVDVTNIAINDGYILYDYDTNSESNIIETIFKTL